MLVGFSCCCMVYLMLWRFWSSENRGEGSWGSSQRYFKWSWREQKRSGWLGRVPAGRTHCCGNQQCLHDCHGNAMIVQKDACKHHDLVCMPCVLKYMYYISSLHSYLQLRYPPPPQKANNNKSIDECCAFFDCRKHYLRFLDVDHNTFIVVETFYLVMYGWGLFKHTSPNTITSK